MAGLLAAGGVRWLGRVTQTLPSPFFASFPKSRTLTQTEAGCEQFGGLYLGAERRVGFCLGFNGVLSPLGYSPSLRINLYEL